MCDKRVPKWTAFLSCLFLNMLFMETVIYCQPNKHWGVSKWVRSFKWTCLRASLLSYFSLFKMYATCQSGTESHLGAKITALLTELFQLIWVFKRDGFSQTHQSQEWFLVSIFYKKKKKTWISNIGKWGGMDTGCENKQDHSLPSTFYLDISLLSPGLQILVLSWLPVWVEMILFGLLS